MDSCKQFETFLADKPQLTGSERSIAKISYFAGRNAALFVAKRGIEIDGTEWQLVPVEPTEKMLVAGDVFLGGTSELGNAWEAMLDAAKEQT